MESTQENGPQKQEENLNLEQQEKRRSAAKEHWRNFLEALQEVEETEDTNTIAGKTTHTMLELAQVQRDLEDTAGNLADLEIEFAQDLQCLHMGLASAFDDSFATLDTLDNSFHNQEFLQEDELGPFSIRSQGTHCLGTSIRSIRHHARDLNEIKKDIENTFRQTLQQENHKRRSSMASVATASVTVEEEVQFGLELEPEVEAKFQTWFERFWQKIEELRERQRFQREQHPTTHDPRQQSHSLPDCSALSQELASSDNVNPPRAPQPQAKPPAGMGLFHVRAVPDNPEMVEVNGSLYTHQEFKRLLRDLHNQM